MTVEDDRTLVVQAPRDSCTFKGAAYGFQKAQQKFTFTKIFTELASQKEFFDDTMLATVKDFIDGQNCLLFMYGVTNSGKTYTIQGIGQFGS